MPELDRTARPMKVLARSKGHEHSCTEVLYTMESKEKKQVIS